MSAPQDFDLDGAAAAFMEHNQRVEDNARAKAAEVHPPHAAPDDDKDAPGSGDSRGEDAGTAEDRRAETTPEPGAAPEAEAAASEEEPPEPTIDIDHGEEGDEDDPLVEVVVQGERLEVPFSELRKGYQRQADYTKKTEELAQQRREIEAAAQQVLPQQQQALAQTQQLAAQLQQQLAQYQPSPQQLAELEQSDPGAYSAYMLKRQQQQQLVAAAEQAAQQQQVQAVQARIPQERAALQAVDDDFRNDFNGTYARVGAWVTSEGKISPDEWRDVIDHRLVRIAKIAMDAMQGRQATRRENVRVARKVAKLPKVRPSVPKDDRDTANEQYDRAISHLQQGHQSNEDIGAAWLAFDQRGGGK